MTTKTDRIDELMERASQSLTQTAYFESERISMKALTLARKGNDFERLARIMMPLQEARRQRFQLALDVGDPIRIVEGGVTEDMQVEPGCYMVQPPIVGADARRLRLAAFNRDVPVAVLCREPTTRIGLWPVVAISPGLTMRTMVRPPAKAETPDLAWFVQSLVDLGDAGIETVDPSMPPVRRLDALLQRLDAHPEHEVLHQVVEETARECAAAADD